MLREVLIQMLFNQYNPGYPRHQMLLEFLQTAPVEFSVQDFQEFLAAQNLSSVILNSDEIFEPGMHGLLTDEEIFAYYIAQKMHGFSSRDDQKKKNPPAVFLSVLTGEEIKACPESRTEADRWVIDLFIKNNRHSIVETWKREKKTAFQDYFCGKKMRFSDDAGVVSQLTDACIFTHFEQALSWQYKNLVQNIWMHNKERLSQYISIFSEEFQAYILKKIIGVMCRRKNDLIFLEYVSLINNINVLVTCINNNNPNKPDFQRINHVLQQQINFLKKENSSESIQGAGSPETPAAPVWSLPENKLQMFVETDVSSGLTPGEPEVVVPIWKSAISSHSPGGSRLWSSPSYLLEKQIYFSDPGEFEQVWNEHLAGEDEAARKRSRPG